MKNKTLSDFEWQIMRILWRENKISVRDVHAKISQTQQRAYTTVQTYMERLVKKKFLNKEKIDAVNFYSPIVNREEMQKNETHNFIKKTFNGSFSKMAAFLFDVDEVSENDLEKIKSLLKEKENE
jgi:predicted transcriptional regulator